MEEKQPELELEEENNISQDHDDHIDESEDQSEESEVKARVNKKSRQANIEKNIATLKDNERVRTLKII